MGISISGVGSGAAYTPAPDIATTQGRPTRQRAAAEQLMNTLPGNNRRTPQELIRIASDIASVGKTFNRKLQFVVDQQSQEVIVKVIDKETDKVVKVLPPEELQRLHRKLRETIGFLFNEKV